MKNQSPAKAPDVLAEEFALAHPGRLDLPHHSRLNIYQMCLRDGFIAGWWARENESNVAGPVAARSGPGQASRVRYSMARHLLTKMFRSTSTTRGKSNGNKAR